MRPEAGLFSEFESLEEDLRSATRRPADVQNVIFSTRHKNVKNLEFSKLLPDVVTIADEVDAQLKQPMLRFMAAEASKMAKSR